MPSGLTQSHPTTTPSPQSAIFDFPALLTVLLLLICTAAYVRAATYNAANKRSFLDEHKRGILGLAWKCARVGERLSPWVAVACIAMAVHTLFVR